MPSGPSSLSSKPEKTGRIDRLCRIAIETFLLCMVALTPWAFGSVEPWAIGLIRGVAAAVLMLWSIRVFLGGKSSLSGRAPVFFCLLLTGIFALQMIPLPLAIAEIIMPRGLELRESLLPEVAATTASNYSSLSVGWEKSFQSSLTFVAFAVLLMAALSHLQSVRSIRRLFVTIAGTGFALAVFGIVQKITGNGDIYWTIPLTRGGTPFGPYVNRNHFAGFLEMATLATMGFTVYRAQQWKRERGGSPFSVPDFLSDKTGSRIIFLALASIVMMASVFFSLSRGGMVALSLGCVVFLLGIIKRPFTVLGMTAVLLAAGSLVLFLGGEELMNRLLLADALTLRLELWESCFALIQSFPVLGVGVGNFADVLPAFQDFPAHRTFTYAESDWWHFTAELGLLGLGIILAAGIWFARTLIRGFLNSTRHQPLLLGLMAGIFAIAVHGFVDFNLHIPANAVLFVLIAAASWNLARRSSDSSASRLERVT